MAMHMEYVVNCIVFIVHALNLISQVQQRSLDVAHGGQVMASEMGSGARNS